MCHRLHSSGTKTFSVANPGFLGRGRRVPTSKGGASTYHLIKFSQKLLENEEMKKGWGLMLSRHKSQN